MSTTVILVWIYGNDPYTDPPDDIFGPYTKPAAEHIAATLQCHHRMRTINTNIPEWATT